MNKRAARLRVYSHTSSFELNENISMLTILVQWIDVEMLTFANYLSTQITLIVSPSYCLNVNKVAVVLKRRTLFLCKICQELGWIGAFH